MGFWRRCKFQDRCGEKEIAGIGWIFLELSGSSNNSQELREVRDAKRLLKNGRFLGRILRNPAGIDELPRDKNESRRRIAPLFPQLSRSCSPLKPGKIEVAQNNVVVVSAEQGQRFLGALRRLHFHAPHGEPFLHDLPDALLVVHDEDAVAQKRLRTWRISTAPGMPDSK